MGEAMYALADVHRWLCDNLSEGNAGKVCGMLSVVSRHISKLEAKNAKLQELVRDYEHCTMHAECSRCEYDGKMSTHCPLSPCFPDADELRDLGVDA